MHEYKVVSGDNNGKLISLECYRTKVMNYQILFFGNVFYDQLTYSFYFLKWSDDSLLMSKKSNTSNYEDSEFFYTPRITIHKNFKELHIETSLMNKFTGQSSTELIKGLKIK